MSVLHVLFTVGDASYVVPAADVVQMESYEGVTPVPGVAPYVAGVVQIRGQVMPVVDLRVRFGLPAVSRGLGTRIVVVNRSQRAVGLLVDSAREVVRIEPSSFEPPPPVVVEQARGFVDAIASVNKRLVMRLDFDQVVGRDVDDREVSHGQQG